MPFKSYWYYTGERGNMNPSIAIREWEYQNIEYFINCSFNEGSFCLKVGTTETTHEISSEIESILTQNHSFILNENHLDLTGIQYDQIETKFVEILNTLKGFN